MCRVLGSFKYEVSNIVDKVPVQDITGLCVNVNVNENKYVTDFVNKNYFK